MKKIDVKKFEKPDEVRSFAANGRVEILNFGGGTVGRGIFEPGFKWSTDVKPLAGTESCQSAHSCYILEGRMKIKMNNGETFEVGPGDVAIIPPGHDAWTLGDVACVAVDFSGMDTYAIPSRGLPEERAQGATEQVTAH